MTSAYRCFHCDQFVPAGEMHSHKVTPADTYTVTGKEILRNGRHFADVIDDEAAQEIVRAMNHRDLVLAKDSLLIECVNAGDMALHALHEAVETFGYLHAVRFGIEDHLKENGWKRPSPKSDQEAASDEERPF